MIIPSIDDILPHLLALFSVKKMSHAYILDGLPLSMHLSTSDRLHEQIMAQGYTDIHSPEIEEGKSIKVDDVREIINKLSVKPKSSCHWIILPYTELMNQSAANALLKILEEPPGSCCFLMLSARSSNVLQTIRSRSQKLLLRPVVNVGENERYYSVCAQELMLDEKKRLVPVLDKVLHSSVKLTDLHKLDIKDGRILLQALIQLLALHAVEAKGGTKLFQIYDDVLKYYRLQSKQSILNQQVLVDRVAIWLDQLAEAI